MKQTKLSELGLPGRLLISFFIAFAATGLLAVAALFAANHAPQLGIVLVLAFAPGFIIAGLLFGNGGVGELFGGLWVNATLYCLLVFVIWQWQIRRRSRRAKQTAAPVPAC